MLGACNALLDMPVERVHGCVARSATLQGLDEQFENGSSYLILGELRAVYSLSRIAEIR
jgi:hypothetical protein